MSREKQRYEIIINKEGQEITGYDMNLGKADDVAATIYADEYMENFQIEEDGMNLVLTGVFKESAIEEYDGIQGVMSEMRELDYIENVKKSNL